MLTFRKATGTDLQSLACLRAKDSHEISFWEERISLYLQGIHNPQHSLAERIIYVAELDKIIVGLVAGQLTTRYGCHGELQWLDVAPDHRRKKIASKLVKVIAGWFNEQQAYKICVDPGNEAARLFYAANGAINLNAHWMYWVDIREILV
jgi:GNAT superfamily N-acetyltransferase